MQTQGSINSVWWSATCGWQIGKCGVFILSHSHQARPIPIPVKLAYRFPFPWDSHGTQGNSRFMHTLLPKTRGLVLSYCSPTFMLSFVIRPPDISWKPYFVLRFPFLTKARSSGGQDQKISRPSQTKHSSSSCACLRMRTAFLKVRRSKVSNSKWEKYIR